ncbi:MAG: LuxR family transcriptional regulator [Pseudomonadota bacterium]
MEPFLEGLSQVRTLDELSDRIGTLRDALNVEHIVYHSVNSTGEQYAALTYSPDWVERYIDADYARIDPVVQGCYRRFVPVNWKALDWSGKPQRSFMGEAIDAGVGNQGFSVPIRGPSGQFAMFTVSDRATDDEWDAYTTEHMRSLILAAHFVNQKALEIERGTDELPQKSLSPRETDTLRMLAMGYSRAQAADAMTISEHTLRVYLESARNKLGAMNTTHAVARALSMGLIIV